jgi:hypothetical protein
VPCQSNIKIILLTYRRVAGNFALLSSVAASAVRWTGPRTNKLRMPRTRCDLPRSNPSRTSLVRPLRNFRTAKVSVLPGGLGYVGIGWRRVRTAWALRGQSDGTRVVGAARLREAASTGLLEPNCVGIRSPTGWVLQGQIHGLQ